MSVRIVQTPDAPPQQPEDGLGCLRSDRGNLPLHRLYAEVAISGLVARTELTQGFHNPHPVPVEATYIFPLPDRAAVTAMRMTAADRVVEARLQERGQARQAYDEAIGQGRRAAIAEQERPDVFTMRVGNILPGERVSVVLTLVGPLSYEDGEATYRLPLVVAPRYIPGAPVDGDAVGTGGVPDTDAVPDASRITPPVLLPGFPRPVELGIEVTLEPAGLPLTEIRSSLHAVRSEGNRLRIEPGERLNRDFILRLCYGQPDQLTHALTLVPDSSGAEGTFRLTVLPPTAAAPPRARDVVLLLDRSGSMSGWKIVAARRAAARIVDTLTDRDRFAVLSFDHLVEVPEELGGPLVPANDRNRFRAVRHLASVQARGGTELLAPLAEGIALLGSDPDRDRVLVLVTDGQVGNEDQIIAEISGRLSGIRVHTVGIDQAVNAGFLGRLAAIGGGRCELVESEDRLDVAMQRIHRRIAAPVVSGLAVRYEGLDVIAETVTPARILDIFPGAPLVIAGRYRGAADTTRITVTGRTRDGSAWTTTATGLRAPDPAVTVMWARAYLGDLEDRFAASGEGDADMVQASLRFGVLSRFTAWLAEDSRVVTDGTGVHHITQPVEQPAGWQPPPPVPPGPPPAGGMNLLAVAAAPGMRRMGFAARRPARRPGRASAAADVSAQIRDELGRLQTAAALPDLDRRELLADLGSRLAALLADVSNPAAAVLKALLPRLDEDEVLALPAEEFEALWRELVAALTGFAGQ